MDEKREVEIIPAILPKNFKDLLFHLKRLRGVSRKVQVDIVEGGFFPWQKRWPFRDKGSFAKVLKEGNLPYWTDFDVEVDLMVDYPKELALQFVSLHTSRVVVHAARPGALEAATVLAEYDEEEHPFPIGVGVAIGVAEPLDILEPFEHLMDYAQVMGIAKVGAQGRTFDERALTVIERLRKRYPLLTIQVDGGVAPNVGRLAKAGATRLVVGSAIIQAKDPGEVYKKLYTEANVG